MQNLKRNLFIFALFLYVFTIILSDNADAAGSFKKGNPACNKKPNPTPKTSRFALTPPKKKELIKKLRRLPERR